MSLKKKLTGGVKPYQIALVSTENIKNASTPDDDRYTGTP